MQNASHNAMNEDDPFLVSSKYEIYSLLRAIQVKGALLRMHIPGREVAIITTILEVDNDSNTLIVDNSADEDFNRRIVKAEEISFDTMLDKIRIQFTVPEAASCMHDNRPAIRLPMPVAVTRIQRREYYRIDIPVTAPAYCLFTLEDSGQTKTVKLEIKDISAGGISVQDHDRSLDHTQGTTYKACRMDLPESGQVVTDLRMMRALNVTLPNGKETWHLGCKFIELPGPMNIIVQNYIGKLERRLNAKRRGFD
ncbi:MAG TPA: flagellar brake protein [Candidimonas sp.]|nr:flagellar brake protein [Candidimonas sp.]